MKRIQIKSLWIFVIAALFVPRQLTHLPKGHYQLQDILFGGK